MSRAPADIASRMTDYFNRQIEWFEKWACELEAVDNDLKSDSYNRLEDKNTAWEKNSKALNDEFRALKKEWDSTRGLAETERASVRALAEKAETLSDQIQQTLEQAASAAGDKSKEVENALNEMRQGRDTVTKYQTGITKEGKHLDQST